MSEYRADKSGLARDIQKKLKAKYNVDQEKQCREWINCVLGEDVLTLDECGCGMDEFAKDMKDGTILCRLINKLHEEIHGHACIKKINNQKMPFKQMENIENFLKECVKFGLKEGDCFQTADLYEAQNMSQVLVQLYSLSSVAAKNGYNGPSIGAKMSAGNKRNFTEQQIADGKAVIGLQMGTNKGASQAGMSIGKTRAIMD